MKEETEKSAATEVEIAASWLVAVNRVHPTNKREPTDIVVVGKNFGQYDFSPAIMPYFQCTYALSTDAKKTHVTVGRTKRTLIPDVRAFIFAFFALEPPGGRVRSVLRVTSCVCACYMGPLI